MKVDNYKDSFFTLCYFVFLLCALGSQYSMAQEVNRNVHPDANVFGEVRFEDLESGRKDNYSEIQNEALAYIQAVAGSAKSKQPVAKLDSRSAHYLSGLYLYCASRSGACPFILDSILVADRLNRKANSDENCQSMIAFWTAWVKNDFEKRLAYLVPLAANEKYKDFTNQKKLKYTRCKETVQNMEIGAEYTKSLALTQKLIEQIKEKQINVFKETGALAEEGLSAEKK